MAVFSAHVIELTIFVELFAEIGAFGAVDLSSMAIKLRSTVQVAG